MSHFISIGCVACGKTEPVGTANINTWDFDDADWEMETINVPMCIECKGAKS